MRFLQVGHRTRVNIDHDALLALRAAPEVQRDIDRRAKNVLLAQQRRVPVRTGALKRSLGIRDTADGLGREIGAIDANNEGIEYGAAVENGSDHVSPRGKHYHIDAQPFVKPSIDAARL